MPSDTHSEASVMIRFAGRDVRAARGMPVAVALWSAGERVLARSIKYHRPRGAFCFDGHCGGCLMRIGGLPNLRACMEPCTEGLDIEGQNAYPSQKLDVLSAVDWLFPRGMDHHTMMTGSRVLSAVTQKLVRQLSGLGTLPDQIAATAEDAAIVTPDVCVVGGGPAGLAAATEAATTGARVVLIDEMPEPGGSLRADPRYGPEACAERTRRALASGAEILASAQAIGFFPEDRGGVLAVATRSRLLLFRPRATVYATGGYAQNLPFEDNDRPGVIAARGGGRLLLDHGISPGQRVVLAAAPDAPVDFAEALTEALTAAGSEVIVAQVLRARGRQEVTGAVIRDPDGKERTVDCDAILVWATPAPATELLRQHGCAVRFCAARGGFAVTCTGDGQTDVPGVFACGDVTGYVGPEAATDAGQRAGARACEAVR